MQGTIEGEKQCSDMIETICKDVEKDSKSFDFCADFCFFSGRECNFLYDYDDEEDGGEEEYDDADDYEERVRRRRH